MLALMREPEFTRRVWELITPEKRPALFRIIVDGLTAGLSDGLRERVAGDVWGWLPERSLAPDLVIGGARDEVRAVLEFKSRYAAANGSRLSGYRRLRKAEDPTSQRIANELMARDSAMDAHTESDCGDTCGPRKVQLGVHHLTVEQADVYRTTVDYFDPKLTVGSLEDVLFVFVSPHDKAKREFFHYSICQPGEEWQVVELADVLRHWREHIGKLDGADRANLAVLINAGREYLGAARREAVEPVT